MATPATTTAATAPHTLLKPHLACRRKLSPLRLHDSLVSRLKGTLDRLNPLHFSLCKRAFSPRSSSPGSVGSDMVTSGPFEKALIRIYRHLQEWSAVVTSVDETIAADGLIHISRYAITREEESWCKSWLKSTRKMLWSANNFAIYKPLELETAIDRTGHVADMLEILLEVGGSRGEWEGSVREVEKAIRKLQGGSGASSCLTIEG